MMHSPTRLLVLAALVLGCATGNGTAEGDIDEDAATDPKPLDATEVTDDAGSLFPFLDRPVDTDVHYGSAIDATAVDAAPARDVPVAPDVPVARDVPVVDTPVSCPAPRQACGGGGCVDVSVNPAHCGGCSRACGVGETCVAGACQSACVAPRTMCSGACVDRSTDVAHCGACGRLCAAGQSCAAGVCTSACPAPSAMCGSACVDRSTDVANCGACGVRCLTGQSCTAGVCRSPTPTSGVGQPCSRASLCGGGLLCRLDWPSGYCTDYCYDDGDCDPGSVCISDGFDDFCARACTASTQCRAGYGCYRISATGGACAPL